MTVVADLDFRYPGGHAGYVYRTGLGRSRSVTRVCAPALRPSGRGYHARSRYSGADCGYSRSQAHDVDGGVFSRSRAVAQFVGRVFPPTFRSAVHYCARVLIAGREVGNAGCESGYLYRGHRVRPVSVTELVIIVLSPAFRGSGYDGAGVAASGGYMGRPCGNSRHGSRRGRVSSGSFSELPIPVVTPTFHRSVRENRTGEAAHAETLETPDVSHTTSTGTSLVVVVPSQSCPFELLPQHLTQPAGVTAQLKPEPLETWIASRRLSITTRA